MRKEIHAYIAEVKIGIMFNIKRCAGCGEIIWPWQYRYDTLKMGPVHINRDCVLDAWYKCLKPKTIVPVDTLYLQALNKLGVDSEEAG